MANLLILGINDKILLLYINILLSQYLVEEGKCFKLFILLKLHDLFISVFFIIDNNFITLYYK